MSPREKALESALELVRYQHGGGARHHIEQALAMPVEEDFLDEVTRERTARNPEFPEMVTQARLREVAEKVRAACADTMVEVLTSGEVSLMECARVVRALDLDEVLK